MRVDVDPVLLMYAFRYAFGRKTYAVGDVADAMLEHSDALAEWADQIVREISDGITTGAGGMDMDVRRWQDVAERFRPTEATS